MHRNSSNLNKQKQESKDNLVFLLYPSHQGTQMKKKSSADISSREQNKSKLTFLIQNIYKTPQPLLRCAVLTFYKKKKRAKISMNNAKYVLQWNINICFRCGKALCMLQRDGLIDSLCWKKPQKITFSWISSLTALEFHKQFIWNKKLFDLGVYSFVSNWRSTLFQNIEEYLKDNV